MPKRPSTKPRAKSKLTRQTSKLRWLWVILAIIILGIAAYLAYQSYLDYTDRKKFETLKSDMLSLQAEFNKINPGWEYREGCNRKGGKFEMGASSCGVTIKLKDTTESQYKKLLEIVSRQGLYSIGGTDSIKGEFYDADYQIREESLLTIGLTNMNVPSANCSMSGKVAGNDNLRGVTVSCGSSARNFYFKENTNPYE